MTAALHVARGSCQGQWANGSPVLRSMVAPPRRVRKCRKALWRWSRPGSGANETTSPSMGPVNGTGPRKDTVIVLPGQAVTCDFGRRQSPPVEDPLPQRLPRRSRDVGHCLGTAPDMRKDDATRGCPADSAAADPAVAKVVDRVVGGFQRVAAGVEQRLCLDPRGPPGSARSAWVPMRFPATVISPSTSCMVGSVIVPP